MSVSWRTAPNDQMSPRLSADRPFACAGDMYTAAPRVTPRSVIAGDVIVGACIASRELAPAGSSR